MYLYISILHVLIVCSGLLSWSSHDLIDEANMSVIVVVATVVILIQWHVGENGIHQPTTQGIRNSTLNSQSQLNQNQTKGSFRSKAP